MLTNGHPRTCIRIFVVALFIENKSKSVDNKMDKYTVVCS